MMIEFIRSKVAQSKPLWFTARTCLVLLTAYLGTALGRAIHAVQSGNRVGFKLGEPDFYTVWVGSYLTRSVLIALLMACAAFVCCRRIPVWVGLLLASEFAFLVHSAIRIWGGNF